MVQGRGCSRRRLSPPGEVIEAILIILIELFVLGKRRVAHASRKDFIALLSIRDVGGLAIHPGVGWRDQEVQIWGRVCPSTSIGRNPVRIHERLLGREPCPCPQSMESRG